MKPDEALRQEMSPPRERGLHFICLNGNIARQFEFVNNTWLNSPKFAGLYDDADPLVAPSSPHGGTFTVQSSSVRERVTERASVRLGPGRGVLLHARARRDALPGEGRSSDGRRRPPAAGLRPDVAAAAHAHRHPLQADRVRADVRRRVGRILRPPTARRGAARDRRARPRRDVRASISTSCGTPSSTRPPPGAPASWSGGSSSPAGTRTRTISASRSSTALRWRAGATSSAGACCARSSSTAPEGSASQSARSSACSSSLWRTAPVKGPHTRARAAGRRGCPCCRWRGQRSRCTPALTRRRSARERFPSPWRGPPSRVAL